MTQGNSAGTRKHVRCSHNANQDTNLLALFSDEFDSQYSTTVRRKDKIVVKVVLVERWTECERRLLNGFVF